MSHFHVSLCCHSSSSLQCVKYRLCITTAAKFVSTCAHKTLPMFILIPYTIPPHTRTCACLMVMQVFILNGTQGLYRFLGRELMPRCQESCWTRCLAPKDPGTTHCRECGTNTDSPTHTLTHCSFQLCIPEPHFVQTLATEQCTGTLCVNER